MKIDIIRPNLYAKLGDLKAPQFFRFIDSVVIYCLLGMDLEVDDDGRSHALFTLLLLEKSGSVELQYPRHSGLGTKEVEVLWPHDFTFTTENLKL